MNRMNKQAFTSVYNNKQGTFFFLSRSGIEPEASENNDIAMTTTPSAQGHYKNGSLVALAHPRMARQGEVIPKWGN